MHERFFGRVSSIVCLLNSASRVNHNGSHSLKFFFLALYRSNSIEGVDQNTYQAIRKEDEQYFLPSAVQTKAKL